MKTEVKKSVPKSNTLNNRAYVKSRIAKLKKEVAVVEANIVKNKKDTTNATLAYAFGAAIIFMACLLYFVGGK